MSSRRHLLPFLVLLALISPIFIRSSHAADGGQTATQEMGKNVVGFKLGGYFPESSELENFDIGGHGEVSVARNVSQYFGVGAAIGMFQMSNTTNALVSQGGTLTSTGVDQTVRSTYVILNATLMIPAGAFTPYVEGGGGFYFTNIEESSSIGSNSKDDTSFGYHVGAGLNWFFTNDYFIGLGGRYIWTETNDTNIRLDGIQADVNLGVRF